LKEYINSIDDNPNIKLLYDRNVGKIKPKLQLFEHKVKDPSLKIKLGELSNILSDNKPIINSDNIVELFQYYDLIDELDKVDA